MFSHPSSHADCGCERSRRRCCDPRQLSAVTNYAKLTGKMMPRGEDAENGLLYIVSCWHIRLVYDLVS